MGGVIRLSRNFENLETTRLLYSGLVCSRLEYESIIWNSCHKSCSDQIEMVQKRFLRFLYLKKHGRYPYFLFNPVRTIQMEAEFKLSTPIIKRRIADCLFIFKIINGLVDCSYILGCLPIRYHSFATRKPATFLVKKVRNKYDSNQLLNRAIHHFNMFPSDLDPFLGVFKSFLWSFYFK